MPIMLYQPSTMSLYIDMQFQGQSLASGTGFVVSRSGRSYLVTNRHNVRGRRNDNDQILHPMGAIPDSIVIYHNVANQLGSWMPKVERLYDSGGRSLWLEHPALGGRADVVALPLTDLGGVDIQSYDPWFSGVLPRAAPSDSVSIPGFPFGRTAAGLLAIWVHGTLASERSVDFDGLPLFLVDSRTRPGSSGSPVIFFRSGGDVAMEDGVATYSGPIHWLLGVYSGRISADSDLGLVWKTAVVADIVDGQHRASDMF